jgi:hypothetical protein
MSELGNGHRIKEASDMRVFGRFRADASDPTRSAHATCSAADCKSANKNLPKLFGERNLARAKKHSAKMLRQIKFAHCAGKKKLRDRLIVVYFQSIDARVLAVDEAYHSLRPSKRPAKKMLASIAEAICPYQPSDEPVIVNMKTKPNGNYRLVNDFGIRQRARQFTSSVVAESL